MGSNCAHYNIKTCFLLHDFHLQEYLTLLSANVAFLLSSRFEPFQNYLVFETLIYFLDGSFNSLWRTLSSKLLHAED